MTSTSEQGYQNLTLCVPRRSSLPASAGPAEHLANPTVVSSHVQDVGVGGVIPPNHVLLRVERFGFSANNVTYGLLGEDPHFRSVHREAFKYCCTESITDTLNFTPPQQQMALLPRHTGSFPFGDLLPLFNRLTQVFKMGNESLGTWACPGTWCCPSKRL